MKKVINFTKMVASGNDFIILKQPRISSFKLKRLAKDMCDRKYGIGADGMLVLEKTNKRYNFSMSIFNPDGTRPQMCGNGVRCASLYWAELKNAKSKDLKIKTKAGIIESKVCKDNIKVKMTKPKHLKLDLSIKLNEAKYNIHFIDTGVPHVVLFSEDLERIDVNNLGRSFRFHEKFKPNGTNVNFVHIIDVNNIEIRTYERGVEDETLACGTGAVASSLVTACILQLKGNRSINVHTEGGESLRVYFNINDKKISDVWLEGNAKVVFQGRLSYV